MLRAAFMYQHNILPFSINLQFPQQVYTKSVYTKTVDKLNGEKYRAMIQQKSRNRRRGQDAFDIYWLLKRGYLDDRTLQILIYRSFLIKAQSRQLAINKDSLADKEIVARSKAEYATLADEIDGELPPFEEVYTSVKNYYEALPWGK